MLANVKIGLAITALVAVGWAAWYFRGLEAEQEKVTAVNAAVEAIQKDLDNERKLRAHFETLADQKLAKLFSAISGIKIEHKTITNNIQQEVKENPEFYSQPLPPGGFEQWTRARALISTASPASSAASR